MKKILFFLLAAFVSGAQAQSCCDRDTANPPAFTWAAKPTCSTAATGRQIRVTNVGPNDWVAACDGTNWEPVGGSVLLLQFNTPTTVTGTAGADPETIIGSTVTIPGGFLGTNGTLRVETFLRDITSSTNAKVTKIRWGTTSGSGCTGNTQISTQNNTSITDVRGLKILTNNNSASVQEYQNSALQTPYGSTGGDGAQALDTTVDTYLCFTLQVDTNLEVATVSSLNIWATPAP